MTGTSGKQDYFTPIHASKITSYAYPLILLVIRARDLQEPKVRGSSYRGNGRNKRKSRFAILTGAPSSLTMVLWRSSCGLPHTRGFRSGGLERPERAPS
jgi:hypothetical protein